MELKDNLDEKGFLDLSRFSPKKMKEELESLNLNDLNEMKREDVLRIKQWDKMSDFRRKEITKIQELIGEIKKEGHTEKNADVSVLNVYLESLWK